MKNTIKVILVITLFSSTTSIALAGDQTSGGGCESCKSIVEPGLEVPEQPITTTTEQRGNVQNNPVVRNDENDDLSNIDEELLNFLRNWFGHIFG